MSTPITDPVEGLKKLLECLEFAKTTLSEHQRSIRDLNTIVQLQQQSIERLKAKCDNLEERVKQQEGFAA